MMNRFTKGWIAVKNVLFGLSLIVLFMGAMSVEVDNITLAFIMAGVAAVSFAISAVMERILILNYRGEYTPIFTFNQGVKND